MILYEVTATPEAHVRGVFEAFMRETHIDDVLATGCFIGAHFEETAAGIYRTTYIANAQEDLDRYFAQHAQRLREHVAERFPSGVTFGREVWRVLQDYGGQALLPVLGRGTGKSACPP
jgi:Domain of unknown function (DUF4286)